MRHDKDLNRGSTTAVDQGVVPLKDLKDFQVAKGDPDVRGWEVLSNDGRRIGKVDDLLVDTAAMRVRYLDIDLDNDLRNLAGGGTGPGTKRDNILIPIGSAQLHEKDDRVTVDLLHSLVSGIPGYDRNTFNREHETNLRQHFDRDYRQDPNRDFYEHDLYNDSRFYGNRRDRR
ncbi:MAG TPA: PRC-barrel domain-containing protein [Thermoanaerobaculia bacterium]|nr:PRC-barrel domain-containing protein [Thermoanaerobaculia bacterium]